MSSNTDELAVDKKSKEIDKIISILKTQRSNVWELKNNLETLERVENLIRKALESFKDFDFKEPMEIVRGVHDKIVHDISGFEQMKEEVDELVSHFDKQAEVDVIVGALEIIAKDSKEPKLKENLEGLIFYIKENGTGDDSIILLSRASWKW